MKNDVCEDCDTFLTVCKIAFILFSCLLICQRKNPFSKQHRVTAQISQLDDFVSEIVDEHEADVASLSLFLGYDCVNEVFGEKLRHFIALNGLDLGVIDLRSK
mgnify:CR=1 FL=1